MHAEDGLQLERNPLHVRAEDELKTMSPSDERILERFPFPSCPGTEQEREAHNTAQAQLGKQNS